MQDYYSCSSGSGSASEAEGDFDDVNSEASFHTCRTHITTVSDRYTSAGLLSPTISAAAASLVAHSLAAGSRHTPHTSALDSATQAMPAVKSDMLDNVSSGLVGDATGQACIEYNGINTASCGLGNASELDQLVEDAEKGVLSVDPLSGPKLDHEHPDLQAEEPANKRVSAVTKSQVGE